MNTIRWHRRLIRMLAWLVPAGIRREWTEEWDAELVALASTDLQGPAAADYPTPRQFAAGAIPHALWLRSKEWSMDSLMQDLRYALRGLGRTPVFTLVAAATLALGIGANGLIFSLVNGLTFRPPAGITAPERLVQIGRSYDDAPRWDNWAWPAVAQFSAESRTFSGVAGYTTFPVVLGRGTDVQEVMAQHVTGHFFGLLGVRPHLGRPILPSDDIVPGGHPVAVLSHALWTTRFGADPETVGRTVYIGAMPYQVIGIAPREFRGPDQIGVQPQLWIPAIQRMSTTGSRTLDNWGSSWLTVIARLQDGVTEAQAASAMEVLTAQVREANPEQETIRALMAPGIGLDPESRGAVGQMSLLLAGIVGLVLLLTCSNVANLFLARGAGRSTEVGIRMALGAGRSRLVRQLVTESLLVAGLATLMAVPLVAAADSILPHLIPDQLATSLAPDGRVYLFLAGIGLLAGVLFGTAPAWTTVSGNLVDSLRQGGSLGGRSRARWRDAFVVAQLAISLGLVAGAALLGRSVLHARASDPGVNLDGMIAGVTNLASTGRYTLDQGTDLVGRLLAELEAQPWVLAATVANQAPIAGGHARASVIPADRPDDDIGVEAEYTVVGPRYFETLGLTILRGRAFAGLREEAEQVVVVNEALANRFWPGEDPIGQEILRRGTTWRVIGVVRNVQMRSLRAAANPGVYYPWHQAPEGVVSIHVRVAGPSERAFPELRRVVANVDPELPVGTTIDLRAASLDSVRELWTYGVLIAGFAVLALVLAAIGLYGLVSYSVSQRVREMGIRLALGARPSALVGLVMRRTLLVAVVGVAGGIGVAVLLGQALRGTLFGVDAGDPSALLAAAVILFVTAVVAAWIPARRAARVDATVSLKAE